jgi:MATE family multidrug resistance protein
MCHQLFFDLWDLDFPEMGIVGAAIGTIVSRRHVSFMHYILIKTFHPYFENFSLKEIKKKMLNKIINIASLGYANVFEVGLFTGQFGFRDFWERRA